MELAYAEVERLLMRLHGVPPMRRGTMRSRIQLLQRGGFPAGLNVGRGARATYGADATFQLVVAFELASLGWPALATTRLVEAFWPQLRALVDQGLAAAAGDAEPPSRYAVIVPDALAAVRAGETETRVETVSGETLARWVLRASAATAPGFLLLDIVGVARRAAGLLEGTDEEGKTPDDER